MTVRPNTNGHTVPQQAATVTAPAGRPDSRRRHQDLPPWLLPGAASLTGVMLALLIALGVPKPWMPIAATAFLVVAPGACAVPLIGLRDAPMELTLVVPVSFALVTATSAALFYVRLWTPDRELGVLVGLCMACLLLHHLEERWRSRRT